MLIRPPDHVRHALALLLFFMWMLGARPASAQDEYGFTHDNCARLMTLRRHQDPARPEIVSAIRDHAVILLETGHPASYRLALEALAEVGPVANASESSEAFVREKLAKFLVADDGLTQIAGVTALRFIDPSGWSGLKGEGHLDSLKILDRRRAIENLRTIFRDQPWRAEVRIHYVRRAAPGRWDIAGEVIVTDRLALKLNGRPVRLIEDHENTEEDLLLIISGREVVAQSEAIENEDLSPTDVTAGVAGRNSFWIQAVTEDPFAPDFSLNVGGVFGPHEIKKVFLRNHLSRHQLR